MQISECQNVFRFNTGFPSLIFDRYMVYRELHGKVTDDKKKYMQITI